MENEKNANLTNAPQENPDTSIQTGLSPAARKAALSLLPLSPAPLTGPDAAYGWVRLVVYGGLTYATWSRARKLGYVFAGATAMSLGSSLSAVAWNGVKNG